MIERTVHAPSVDEVEFEGEPAVRLRSGTLSATFLPGLGLTGVSLVHEGGEFLALPGGLDALRAGHTSGLPLVGPWVNRLSTTTYRSGTTTVDVAEALASGRVHADGNGLAIHGFLSGRSHWTVDATSTDRECARLRASIDVDDPAFPFPHRLTVGIAARPDGLGIATTVTPTGDRAVPVAYGWHPYLVVPGTPRSRWRLRTPTWRHLALDRLGIPTGECVDEVATDDELGARTFDDLYAFSTAARARHAFGFVGEDGRSVTVRCGAGYTHAQIWVPADKTFASLEPMAAETNALVTGAAPVVAPGASATSSFFVDLLGPKS